MSVSPEMRAGAAASGGRQVETLMRAPPWLMMTGWAAQYGGRSSPAPLPRGSS
jgi:hypothetical protein